jgi:thiamine pyrophosphate-dependent acetolactate synthase large subunit-like protein
MLMTNEVSTAAKYDVEAVWIVLNDSSYGMVEQGMRGQGFFEVDTGLPKTDFAKMAESMGARGVCVTHEDRLHGAIEDALATPGPVVVDVLIERSSLAPFGKRVGALPPSGVHPRSAS